LTWARSFSCALRPVTARARGSADPAPRPPFSGTRGVPASPGDRGAVQARPSPRGEGQRGHLRTQRVRERGGGGVRRSAGPAPGRPALRRGCQRCADRLRRPQQSRLRPRRRRERRLWSHRRPSPRPRHLHLAPGARPRAHMRSALSSSATLCRRQELCGRERRVRQGLRYAIGRSAVRSRTAVCSARARAAVRPGAPPVVGSANAPASSSTTRASRSSARLKK